MLKLLPILAVCLTLPISSVVAQNTYHHNHNDYQLWMTPPDADGDSYGCCNNTDCDIVKELGTNRNNEHIVRWRGTIYVVPESIWLKDQETPDGNSHLCVLNGRPICYVPGK